MQSGNKLHEGSSDKFLIWIADSASIIHEYLMQKIDTCMQVKEKVDPQ